MVFLLSPVSIQMASRKQTHLHDTAGQQQGTVFSPLHQEPTNQSKGETLTFA